jgi:hypothetical protein
LKDDFPSYYEQVGNLLIGEMILDDDGCPDCLTQYKGKLSQRGALMGLPLAWPILTLVNDWAAARAQAPEGLLSPAFVTCGDDMGAAWTRQASDRYLQNIKDAGLVPNVQKSFRSPTGLIFVERLIVKETARVQKLPPLPTRPGEKAAIPEDPDFLVHQRTSIVRRPTMSAIAAAKNMMAEKSTAPLWLSLPATLREEYAKASPRWRKDRVLQVARKLHPNVFRMYDGSKMPLHWPQALGGWGLPGPPDAPRTYRKAAASILNGNDDLLKNLSNAFLLSGAPEHARKHIDLLLSEIPERNSEGKTPTNPYIRTAGAADEEIDEKEKSVTRKEAEDLIMGTVTGYLELLGNKGAGSHQPKFGEITARVRRIINKAATQWKSVRPMGSDKTTEELAGIIDRRRNQPLFIKKHDWLDSHDVTISEDRLSNLHLRPEDRLRSYALGVRGEMKFKPEQKGKLDAQRIRARRILTDEVKPTEPDPLATVGGIPRKRLITFEESLLETERETREYNQRLAALRIEAPPAMKSLRERHRPVPPQNAYRRSTVGLLDSVAP